jgi:hypothetical protein
MSNILFSREWAMLSKDTFSVKPIANFVKKYLKQSKRSVDPFARNCDWFQYTNDINPKTTAKYHLDAREFLKLLISQGIKADLISLDMPYSPRQCAEVYKEIGIKVTMEHTQNARFYKEVRNLVDLMIEKDGVVLSYGYSSTGMGIKRGYEIEEIKLINGGGGHSDIICMAERKYCNV